ncbi:ATP-binding cassette domain-containing protein [Allosphingosinicella deserti]|uniref:ABC transporter ATP-binding protein n=1 Tax=Allosphingosinicella deserti TaxID=2116704 RepID=A0A2P7QI02_9SPHN|nr:ABC transporter ATP-binding protein [Sphingomonas deserti]PSJ37614.1 ABC transporter ATP-binding protein [Sphingomonas deserti]
MANDPFLELHHVAKDLGARPILHAVSLAIPAGSFVALVGPSGSGKTTLLKTINRLIEPDSGSVRLDGTDINVGPKHRLRRRIGYAFQGIGLFPHMNVAENIGVVPRLLGWTEAARAARVAELLDLVALPADFAARRPNTLSGGQTQRVGIARALAARPSLMLMDEPFGTLDPVTRDELGRAYRALHDRLDLTTIMVTHDITEALLLADRIVVLIEGTIRADAAPAELLAYRGDPAVEAMIALPQAQARRLAALVDAR